MGARGLFLLGALALWPPEIVLYAWTKRELSRKLVTFPAPEHFSVGLSTGFNTPTKANSEPLRSHFYGARRSFPGGAGYDNRCDYSRRGI
jgi:hypothetical protein